MAYATLLGHTVYYELAGTGPTVVLLHHATATLENWRPQSELLQAQGYSTLLYDRHGFGRSDPLPAWSLHYHQESVDELLALLDHLHLPSVALVGHSDGATISLMAAAQHPARVAAIVAESPHMWVQGENVERGFAHFRNTVEKNPRFIKAMQRDHGDRAQQVLDRWHARWLDPAFRQWDVSHTLPAVQFPVLVIHGENDIFFPPSHSQTIAKRVQQGTYRLLPGLGHTPHREDRAVFDPLLLDFLATHWPTG